MTGCLNHAASKLNASLNLLVDIEAQSSPHHVVNHLSLHACHLILYTALNSLPLLVKQLPNELSLLVQILRLRLLDGSSLERVKLFLDIE